MFVKLLLMTAIMVGKKNNNKNLTKLLGFPVLQF